MLNCDCFGYLNCWLVCFCWFCLWLLLLIFLWWGCEGLVMSNVNFLILVDFVVGGLVLVLVLIVWCCDLWVIVWLLVW